MYSKIDNVEIIGYDKTDEVIEQFFESILSWYQIGLEIRMKGSDLVFGFVNSLYYKCNKINFNNGRSSINTWDWIKNEKTRINSNNNNKKCFQYAVTIALNQKRNYKRLTKKTKN